MKLEGAKWQGEPVLAIMGISELEENKQNPLFWYNYEYSQNKKTIPSIKITCIEDGYTFYIANYYGVGAEKLLSGGWPDKPHFTIPDKFKFTPNIEVKPIKKFDEAAYMMHETERREWQKENFPTEFRKLEHLESLLKANHSNQ